MQKYLILPPQMNLVKTTFNIQSDHSDRSDVRLFVEIAPQQLSFLTLENTNYFSNLISFSFTKSINECIDDVKKILVEPLCSNHYAQTTIIWTMPENILVPDRWRQKNIEEDMLNLVFGPNIASTHRVDELANDQMINIYRIPGNVEKIIYQTFSNCRQYHQFSILPIVNVKETTLLCIFYHSFFSVLLHIEGKIQFARYFNFNVPEDVIYNLLNICKNYNIDNKEIQINLAGLIEKQSTLYSEIYKYFLHISFLHNMTEAGFYKINEDFQSYPEHFFSHLFAIATCV